MLIQLHISHLATIQSLHLEFKPGTTIFTGESGAGKSVLIDAIELALGKRATSDIIREGHEKADVSLCFDVSKLPDARLWLKSYDLDQDSHECIIRRTIHRDGRSRSFINDMPTTLQPLRELSERLIQIHGQHEHHSLLKTETQRILLDRYAGHQHLIDEVITLAEEWQKLNRDRLTIHSLIEEHHHRGEFLKFQLQELEELNLTPDTFQNLDLEHKQLAHAGELLQNIQYALSLLTDDQDVNALHFLNQALKALETLQQVDPKISSWLESIRHAIICVSDTEDDLRRYLDSINLDPARLHWLDERIRLLFDMARKHKVSPHELFDLKEKLKADYYRLAASDEKLSELNTQMLILEKSYVEVAKKLSQSRARAGAKLAIEINKTFQHLSLGDAAFQIHFEPELEHKILPYGLEKILYLIKTNMGQSLQPLAKIASGGELSRISLAIYLATAGQQATPTLIFDEIDVGIGGSTTEMVGQLLRRLGESHQVFCITHQPQVAAYSHQHIRVTKINKKNEPHTLIQELKSDEKINELARMLGGIEITKKTLAHARELMEKIS